MIFSIRPKAAGIYVVFILAMIRGYSIAQTPNTNYIRTRIPQIAVTDTSKLDTIPIQRQAVSIQYSDALGRLLQVVQVNGSASQKDVILPFEYDNMGRRVKAYLPYADQGTNVSTAGAFRSTAVTDALNFYNPSSPGAPKIPTDVSPYSQTVYEASPLQRVNEQGGVGSVFQPGTGHSVRAAYGVNSVSDGISYYSIQEGSSISTFTFAAGMLNKITVTDENGHRQTEWKDLQGRLVSKSQLDAPTAYYSTDYVYNDLNELTDIIPPSVKKQLNINSFSHAAYVFHYDSLGRVVEKKGSDKGWVYTVYNHTNQPVLTQDSNMRAKNQWMYMKYDAEGRLVQTGLYINTIITSRKALQYLCDTSFPILWETWQPGTGYTNNAFPQQSAIPGSAPLVVYTTYYYDDYSFTEASAKPFQTNIYNTIATGRTMGMLTGVSVYVLGTNNQRLVTVNYYDSQNRLIQEIEDNHLGQVNVINNQYNYIGRLIGTQRITTPIANNPITVRDRYVFDHLGRLMDTYETFQTQAETDISHNLYNEIGEKTTEGLHSTNYSNTLPGTITENTTITSGKTDIATTSVMLTDGFLFTGTSGNTYIASIGAIFAQSQEFRYNIQGMLTSINNGTLTVDGVTQTDPNALFGESITYSETSPVGAAPQYTGNISGITWRNKIEQTGMPGLSTGGQGYAFSYDNVNRLTQASYYAQSGSTFVQSTSGALTEAVSSYDEMGNINALQRKDKAGNTINNLTYTYQSPGNQLVSISDAGTQNINGSFTYDGNGNMTSDSRKGITITYNYLDLPDTVKQGTSKLIITYDAAGNKLYKELISNGTVVSQRHYINEVELTATSSVAADGQVESVSMAEGRIVNIGSGNYQYEYYLQDHLFNNRVAFRPNDDGSVNVTQVQNYYPFGLDMGDATMNYSTSPQNLDKFNGKELQPELNLNTYDFAAREYDPVLARWSTIDPLADNVGDMSPYNYVENNPINLIDPDGMQSTSGANASHIPMGGGPSALGGSWGSAADWAGAGANVISQGAQAWHAFDMKVYLQSWGNAGGLQQTQLRFSFPTPYPTARLGSMDYYRFRNSDFHYRYGNSRQAPDYYLSYGDKYIKRFSYELSHELSPQGKAWLKRARRNLQVLMEKELQRNPQIELNNDAFRKFAFTSHVKAYEDAGLLSLGFNDKILILETPDLTDLVSADGLNQAKQVMNDQMQFYKTHPKVLLQHITSAPSAAQVFFETIMKYLPITIKP